MTLQGKTGRAVTGFSTPREHRGHESTPCSYKLLSQHAFTLWSPYVSTNKRGSEGRTKSTKHPQDAAFPPAVGRGLRASHVTRGTCWWSHSIPPFPLSHSPPSSSLVPSPPTTMQLDLQPNWAVREERWSERGRERGGQDRCFFRKIPKT